MFVALFQGRRKESKLNLIFCPNLEISMSLTELLTNLPTPVMPVLLFLAWPPHCAPRLEIPVLPSALARGHMLDWELAPFC